MRVGGRCEWLGPEGGEWKAEFVAAQPVSFRGIRNTPYSEGISCFILELAQPSELRLGSQASRVTEATGSSACISTPTSAWEGPTSTVEAHFLDFGLGSGVFQVVR